VKKLAADPEGFPAMAQKVIDLEKLRFAWGEEVAALKTPVLIIAGDADGMTLDHSVEMFRLLGGGAMGDAGEPLAASRLAILPASSHTAVTGQTDALMTFIEPFLAGQTPDAGFE
jgi:pimeloyl-ACP methyl ester carboxylesterase